MYVCMLVYACTDCTACRTLPLYVCLFFRAYWFLPFNNRYLRRRPRFVVESCIGLCSSQFFNLSTAETIKRSSEIRRDVRYIPIHINGWSHESCYPSVSLETFHWNFEFVTCRTRSAYTLFLSIFFFLSIASAVSFNRNAALSRIRECCASLKHRTP